MRNRSLFLAVVISAATASTVGAQGAARGTIALSPMEVPLPYGALPSLRVLDSLLTAELSTAGYTVVSGAEAGAVWRHLVDSVQGFYDPITGDRDSVKFEVVRRGTMQDLNSRLHVTLWLHDSITVVTAHWSHNAKWDGMTESVGTGKGDVPALTLEVSVEDRTGRIVASGRGGLQVLYKMHGDKYEPVPTDKLFAETDRMLKGIRIALQPLLAKSGAP